MERIGNLTAGTRAPRVSGSKEDGIAKTIPSTNRGPVPKDKAQAIGDVLDRWRLNNGWNPWDDDSHDAASLSFVHSLDLEGVPPQHYNELYERSLRSRVAAMQNGKQLPTFGVELMIAEWLGPHGLKAALRQREIESGRVLTGNAESQCPKCFGTGVEQFRDAAGQVIGARPGCKHEFVETDEEPHAAGIDDVIAANRPTAREETAIEICKRIRTHLAYLVATAGTDEEHARAWAAASTWHRAERYCRENPD